MAKIWKEPLDTLRHVDHFGPGVGGAGLRRPQPGGFSYFVKVAGFTFEFASVDQIRECLTFFETKIHRSSRQPVFAPEAGEWQAWHERFPARILHATKRARVTKALREAIGSFSNSDR